MDITLTLSSKSINPSEQNNSVMDLSKINIRAPYKEPCTKERRRNIVFQTDIPFGFEVKKNGKTYLATFDCHIVRSDGMVNLKDGVVEQIAIMLTQHSKVYASGDEFIKDFEKYLKAKDVQFSPNFSIKYVM